MPFIFLLGSSGKISCILPAFRFSDPKSLIYILSNIFVTALGLFLVLQFLISSSIYKYPK